MLMGDILEQNSFTSARRSNNKRPLAFPDGSDEINDARGPILDCWIFDFHFQALIRIERRQVVKGNLVTGLLRIFKVDLGDVSKGEIALVVFGLLQ